MIAAEASTSLPRAEPAARARLAQTALFWQTLRTLRNHVADALPEVLTLFTASLGHALQVERTSIWLFDASRTAIAKETEGFPDAPNKPGFPTCVLRPGETYTHTLVHRFSVD